MIELLIGGAVVVAGGIALTVRAVQARRQQVQAMAEEMLRLYAANEIVNQEIKTVEAQQLSSRVADACDIEMGKASVEVLHDFFPRGFEEKLNSMGTAGEREEFFWKLINRLASAMKVEIAEIDFKEFSPDLYGRYKSKDKRIELNADLFLDPASQLPAARLVHTLLHELRHAVQSEALLEGNPWGVAPSRLAEWTVSKLNYVDCTQAYALQSIELDANWYASVVLDMFDKKN